MESINRKYGTLNLSGFVNKEELSLEDKLIKGSYYGKEAFEGEIREWGGKKFKKENRKWIPVEKEEGKEDKGIREGSAQEALLDFLEDGPKTYKQIANHLENVKRLTTGSLSNYSKINPLLESGKITKVGNGIYAKKGSEVSKEEQKELKSNNKNVDNTPLINKVEKKDSNFNYLKDEDFVKKNKKSIDLINSWVDNPYENQEFKSISINSNKMLEMSEINYNTENGGSLGTFYKGEFYLSPLRGERLNKNQALLKEILKSKKISFKEEYLSIYKIQGDFIRNTINKDKLLKNNIDDFINSPDKYLNKPFYFGEDTYSNTIGTAYITKGRNDIYRINMTSGIQDSKDFSNQDLKNRGVVTLGAYYDSKNKTLLNCTSNGLTLGNYIKEAFKDKVEIELRKNWNEDKNGRQLEEKFNKKYEEDSFNLSFCENLNIIETELKNKVIFLNSRKNKGTYIVNDEGVKLSNSTFDGLSNLNKFNEETKKYDFFKEGKLIFSLDDDLNITPN